MYKLCKRVVPPISDSDVETVAAQQQRGKRKKKCVESPLKFQSTILLGGIYVALEHIIDDPLPIRSVVEAIHRNKVDDAIGVLQKIYQLVDDAPAQLKARIFPEQKNDDGDTTFGQSQERKLFLMSEEGDERRWQTWVGFSVAQIWLEVRAEDKLRNNLPGCSNPPWLVGVLRPLQQTE